MWSLRWHFTNRSITGAPYNIKVTVCYTAGHYGEEYGDWNSAVFGSRWNCSSDGAERTDSGKVSHAWAAVTRKAWSPSVVHREHSTTSIDVEALRRRQREPTSAVRRRYDGAVPLRQRYVRMHNRNWILSGTFSQCSSQRSGVMCSDFLHMRTQLHHTWWQPCRVQNIVQPHHVDIQRPKILQRTK